MDVTEAIARLRQDRLDLDAARQDLEGQIRSIKDQQDKIDTAISIMEALDNGTDQVEQPDQTELRQSTRRIEFVGELPGHLLGPQALLRRLLRDRPGVVVDSKSAHELLVEAGWRSESQDAVNVVRSALAQLHKAGDLQRQGRGKYVYRPEDGTDSTQEEPAQEVDMFAMEDDDEPEEEDRRDQDPFAPAPRKLGRTVVGPTQAG